jgi:RNA polymerase sigma-70 factor (ECF subfamily)
MWRFSRDQRVHEELVQDVFVEAYLSLRTYRGKSPFAHWLSRIATRVGYHYWKQTGRQRTTESFSLQEWDQLISSATENRNSSQAAALLHELMAKLPPRDRLVLTLRYLEECDVAETARRTGWTKSMVKVQTWRARKKLQQLFAEMERR